MKKLIGLISIFLFVTRISSAQTLEEAGKLYGRKQYDSAWMVTEKLINQGSSNVDVWVLAGRIQTSRGNFSEAPAYFDKAMTLPNPPTYAVAWALADLGRCYFFKDDFKKAKVSLNGCINLNATKNATNEAKYSLLLMGLDESYTSWVTHESEHFTFHFQDTTVLKNINTFIKSKEAAFEEINKFFQAAMPRKIDYFVWHDDNTGMGKLRAQMAFTNPQLCITHTSPGHTVGHEMTHSIYYQAVKPVYRTQLIAEGVCVYFSQDEQKSMALLKGKGEISIAELWKNGKKGSDEIIYPLGGVLAGRLIKNFGQEKFLKLLANQSYESAQSIYGTELDQVLKQIEIEISR